MKEYSVTCIDFEGRMTDGADLKEPMYGHDYYMDYKPSLDEVKTSCGDLWQYVRYVVITEMPLYAETSDDFVEEIIKNEDF